MSITDKGVHRLELVPLARGGWRLCDRAVPADDASHVVAYIERGRDGFEVVWLRGARRQTRLATIEDAVLEAARLMAQESSTGGRRPVPIPHLAPPRAV